MRKACGNKDRRKKVISHHILPESIDAFTLKDDFISIPRAGLCHRSIFARHPF